MVDRRATYAPETGAGSAPAKGAPAPETGVAPAPYFRTEGLTVGYDGIPLISDIDVSVERGEILTLIGPNGGGKSTILKSITGQLEPIAGTSYLGGRDMRSIDRKELAREMAVMLTERVNPELMTCADVVGMGRYPYTGSLGILTETDHEIVLSSMEAVHIADLAERDFTAISDGQRQRVMLARAICQEPDLMILDEPTSFLDIRYKLELLSTLLEMSRDRGLTVVMSLHEIDLAQHVSDKVMCVAEGRIDRIGTPGEVFTPGYIDRLYGLTVGSYDEATGHVELPSRK